MNTTDELERARKYIEELEDTLDELYEEAEELGESVDIGEVEYLEDKIDEATEYYWSLVDLETEAALAEVEDAMEKGLDLW